MQVLFIDVFGIIGFTTSVLGIILLAYYQETYWWLWSLWMFGNVIWFIHYFIFLDLLSLVLSLIFLGINTIGLLRNLGFIGNGNLKKRRGRKK